jgi:hypothetical protein
MVYNPTQLAGSPTWTGTCICTKVNGSLDELLLPPSLHLSLEVDWMAEEPNAGHCDMERTHFHHRETEEFVGQTSSACQSTERTCTRPTYAKLILLSITLTQSSGENMSN